MIQYKFFIILLMVWSLYGCKNNDDVNIECKLNSKQECPSSLYSIDIYKGKTPFNITPLHTRPIFTSCDLNKSGISSKFVADPFLLKIKNINYLFFEYYNNKTKKGEIGVAESKKLCNFTFTSTVLTEDFHLSYPQLIEDKGNYYMIPESYHDNSIRLYKFIDFPTQLEFVTQIIIGRKFVDSTLFKYKNVYYIFSTSPMNKELRLYYSDNLEYGWVEHPKSPIIIENKHIARPAGNIFKYKNKIYRVTQDDYPTYGNQVRAIEITKLTVDDYKEDTNNSKIIVKASDINGSWNEMGMHQLDMHYINGYYYGIVDGKRKVE